MSDITKKILSLEPEIDADPAATNAPSPTSKTQSAKSAAATSEAKSSKRKKAPIIASVTVPPTVSSTDHASDIPSLRRDLSKPDSFPDFISRPRPNADVTTAPPMRGNERSTRNLTDQNHDMNHNIEPPKTGWIIWTGLALSLIWVAASTALYWGLFGTPKALSPIALSGFIMAVALPAILITLLCISWRRLAQMSHQADRMAHAAQILTRADESALINTRNLALGIQSELSMVDEHLNKMVDRFEGLKTDISSHSHDINTVGLALTERSDDVGRNLTLQRQALESITNTFDTRMETLSDTIETQSQKLSEVTGTAVKNIESAELSLTQATETLSASEKTLLKTGQDTHSTIEKTAQSLTHNQESLSQLHTKISELISALTKEQETVKANLAAQSQSLQDMSSLAKTSTESLQENLNLGADLLTALSSANQGTQETLQQRFKDMEQMIGETQNRADSLAEAANARVRDTISQTRTDLSKLEADMKALGAQLQTAREESLQLSLSDIDTHKPPAQSGFGRLHLKPLETDFPPVEPPRFTSQPRQAHLFDAKQNDEDLSESFDEAFGSPFELSPIDASPVNTSPVNISPINTSPLNTPMEGPINLGADMEIHNPDDELTGFNPNIVADLAPLSHISEDKDVLVEPIGKGFGRARNSKEKAKSGWRWRDMLGGLERPDSQSQAAAAPSSAPLSFTDMPDTQLRDVILSRLNAAKLSPAAIVDEGTIIEAAKARIAQGPAAMLSAVKMRLASPVTHLHSQFAQDIAFQDMAKAFVARHGQKIAQLSIHDTALRRDLGTLEGRAYLLCAAALS